MQFSLGGVIDWEQKWIYDYQHLVMRSWTTQNSAPLRDFFAPYAANTAELTWPTTWLFANFWNLGNDTTAWKREAYPGVDPGLFTWAVSPGPIPQRILFFYQTCKNSVEYNKLGQCSPQPSKFNLFSPDWLPYLNVTGGKGVPVQSNNWIYVYNHHGALDLVLKEMREWLG